MDLGRDLVTSGVACLLTQLLGIPGRRYPANAAVRPNLVVVPTPCGNLGACLAQALEPVLIEALVAELAVEALDVAVLHGTPWLYEDVADVTKGAVQHHFPTREDLVHALYDHLAEEFQAQVADDGSGASAAWRYARIALQGPCADSAKRGKALLAACVSERTVNSKWVDWVRGDRVHDGTDINKLLARLAADGLWLSEVLGIYDLSSGEREALKRLIHQLAEGT